MHAQDSTAVNSTEIDQQREVTQNLSLGISFDYLKLNTLLRDESEKWEAAINLRVVDKISAIGEYGLATLSPQDAYKNAVYTSEGSYFRLGLDYHFTVIPNC